MVQFQESFSSRSVTPYTRIAAFYDQLMAHVNYREWAEYIFTCLNRFGNNIKQVLDGGCGTGSLMSELKSRGLLVGGFDLSRDMVLKARSKGLEFVWQGDLLQPAVRDAWDCMICLYDTIHYLSKEEIPRFFQAVQDSIRPEGLLIFDMVTEHHVTNYWVNYTENGEENGFRYCRRSWYEPGEKCQHTLFEIDQEQGPSYQEHHYQWIHPASFLIERGNSSGFTLIGLFNECTFNDAEHDSDRIHLIFSRRP